MKPRAPGRTALIAQCRATAATLDATYQEAMTGEGKGADELRPMAVLLMVADAQARILTALAALLEE